MLVLPGGYLLIGLYRRTLRGPGVLATQLVGLAVWGTLTLVAVVVGGRSAEWLVALGWLAHAGWDLAHHRSGRVVPRGYTEFCGVLDAILAAVMILAILSTPPDRDHRRRRAGGAPVAFMWRSAQRPGRRDERLGT